MESFVGAVFEKLFKFDCVSASVTAVEFPSDVAGVLLGFVSAVDDTSCDLWGIEELFRLANDGKA